ncbi:unnamed protein product [Rodentolepis nana]|uniref:Uncharacterized protein n=1 Tax=Rodentolepis nana TaxID=102285 RepID=A0A3P7TM41_RODNA|nr:unnamed protein product [Rodentolepis nana]
MYFLCAGQCLYRGPVKRLVPYLASIGFQCPRYHNPSDFLMDLTSVEDDQNAASSTLLTAVTTGRLEEELKRIESSGTSSFSESMNAAIRLVDGKDGLDATYDVRGKLSAADRNGTSIFRKMVFAPSVKVQDRTDANEIAVSICKSSLKLELPKTP